MAAQTSWLGEAPAVNHRVSMESENAALAKIGFDSNEHYGGGLPRIIGNSPALRRVLLSSLEGAAVTSLQIRVVYQEFSTIPGVKEVHDHLCFVDGYSGFYVESPEDIKAAG